MNTLTRFAINLIENDRNELLLLKRTPDAQMGPGLWGFPAGHIEANESPADCSKRENREELGDALQFELLGTLGPVRDSFYGGIYEVHLFHYRWLGGGITLNHEHTAYAWVGPEEYRNYPVMDGMDEDIAYLKIWPLEYLDPDKLPPHLRLP
jgi:8-oxo-dGTP pyrophosphatase MutT (NUDIX family)